MLTQNPPSSPCYLGFRRKECPNMCKVECGYAPREGRIEVSDQATKDFVPADQFELARRIGFALGCITEAMGMLEEVERNDARYWAYKALTRAGNMLLGGRES